MSLTTSILSLCRCADDVAVIPFRIPELQVRLEPHDNLGALGPLERVGLIKLGQFIGDGQEDPVDAVVTRGTGMELDSGFVGLYGFDFFNFAVANLHHIMTVCRRGRVFEVVVANARFGPKFPSGLDVDCGYIVASGAAARPQAGRQEGEPSLRVTTIVVSEGEGS